MRRSIGNCNPRSNTAATVIRRWALRFQRKWRTPSKGDRKSRDSKVVKIGAARPRAKTYYERFMEKEGIPVVEGFGVTDVRNIRLKSWKRLGCDKTLDDRYPFLFHEPFVE